MTLSTALRCFLPIIITVAMVLPLPARSSILTFEEIAKRAAAARESGRLDDAIRLYRQAVSTRPSWGEGWWHLGTLLYDLHRYGQAREVLQRLVSIQPNSGPAWALLGLSEFQLQEHERSLKSIQKARALGVGSDAQLVFATHYHAAILLTRLARFEAALEMIFALARQYKEEPCLIEAMGLNALAMAILPSEIPSDKREFVRTAGKAAYYMAARRMDDARGAYRELIARYPNEPNVHYSYGVFLLLEDTDKALEEFRRELQIWPSHVSARLQIALEYIRRSEYAAGLPFAQQAISVAPQSPVARSTLGHILLETGKTDGAIKELEVGVELAPDDPELRYTLARAYSRAGRKEDAERQRAEFSRLDQKRRAQSPKQ